MSWSAVITLQNERNKAQYNPFTTSLVGKVTRQKANGNYGGVGEITARVVEFVDWTNISCTFHKFVFMEEEYIKVTQTI